MFGTENLKKVILVGIQFGQQVEKSGKDGWKMTDAFSFIPTLAQIPDIINSKDDIVAEFKDLDADERKEISEYVKQNLDLENDRIEGIIEASIDAVISILVLVDKVKAPKAPEVDPNATV